jgi:hypothetical protein
MSRLQCDHTKSEFSECFGVSEERYQYFLRVILAEYLVNICDLRTGVTNSIVFCNAFDRAGIKTIGETIIFSYAFRIAQDKHLK